MKIQCIARTSPLTFTNLGNLKELHELFKLGFTVVMANTWYDSNGLPQGIEYILEADIEDKE